MTIRQLISDDLPEVFSWFEKRKWPYPPVMNLAPEWGFIAENRDGVKLACAFAYVTGTSLAFVDWTATNPAASEKEAGKALTEVIEHMKAVFAKITPKISALCVFTQSEMLADKFSEVGFRKNEGYYKCLWAPK